MVGVLLVSLGASPFVAVDGGYLSQTSLPVPHRTIEVFVPALPMQSLVVSDGDAPQTKLPILIEQGAPARVDDAGVIFYDDSSPVMLSVPEPLTLHLECTGALTLRLDRTFSRSDGNGYFIDTPRASFAFIPSSPFELLGGGRVRVTGPAASLDVQLQVTGPTIPWPVLGGYQSWGASVAWDAARGRITRFGGGDAFELEPGTFVWDPLTGWQQLPIVSPPPRVRASLVYDSMRQRLVLFGGLGAGGLLADTWEFDGTQWVEVTPASGPSARWSHGAAYDESSGLTILFGGLAGSDMSNSELGDTWRWNGFSWTQLQPSASPSPRDAFGMAWDGTRGRITLVAGWDGRDVLNDAWVWSGGDWQPVASLPSVGRASTALAWSPLSGSLLLVGGWDPRGGPAYFSDTWHFDGSSWRPGQFLPLPAARMALVGHPTMGVVMLGGRRSAIFSADTAMLEPVWQRLAQGDRAERGVTSGFTIAGERYAWRRGTDEWLAFWRVPPATRIAAMARASTGNPIFLAVDDAGVRCWDGVSGASLAPPPPFQLVGGNSGQAWVVDLDGGFRRFDGRAWPEVARAPPLIRALQQRASGAEYFAWTDGLQLWSPADGGSSAFGNALTIDGGIVLSAKELTAIATEERGSWHLSNEGNWVFLGLPRLAEPPVDAVIAMDGGLARYEYLKPLGARCEAASECAGGSCASGRCCDRPCSLSCEVCSVAAGAQLDGVCRPAPPGVVCGEAACGTATCDGLHATCPQDVFVCSDGGMDPVEPPRDAGSSRDAGLPPVAEPEPPAGCGCGGAPGALWLLAAIWLRRRGLSRSWRRRG